MMDGSTLAHWCTGKLAPLGKSHTDILGKLAHWHTETHWHTVTLTHWNTGTLRHSETLDCLTMLSGDVTSHTPSQGRHSAQHRQASTIFQSQTPFPDPFASDSSPFVNRFTRDGMFKMFKNAARAL
jgi:hypothetical protein